MSVALRAFVALVLAVSISACAPGLGDDPYAPAGLGRGKSVDGLIVGHRLMEAGEFELAMRAYYRAATHQGVTVDVLSAIGSAQMRLGRLNQSEKTLRDALKKDETFVPAWNNLGVVLIERRKVPEAVEAFKRAFALDSGQTPEIRNNLSLALETQDKLRYGRGQDEEPIINFALVRRGNGSYELLSKP